MRPFPLFVVRWNIGFNPRTHTGCDQQKVLLKSLTPCFNPRTHTGCDARHVALGRLAYCFNPRTHTGCDICIFLSTTPKIVSIHAPTRGATKSIDDINRLKQVSIHAPTRGATLRKLAQLRAFQVSIHAPTRGATKCHFRFLPKHTVSIHAPTRGATIWWQDLCRPPCRFNPRTHTGCDGRPDTFLFCRFGFQSTHPHGVRLGKFAGEFGTSCFNPRTHTGCD